MAGGDAKIDSEQARILRQNHADYRMTFLGSAQGKRVLKDLESFCQLFNEKFHGNSLDAFEKGQRSVFLYILRSMDHNTYAGIKEMERQGVSDTAVFTEPK